MTPDSPSGRRLGAYRLLLRLFPRPFRERRGPAMEQLFLDMAGERAERTGRLGAAFWVRVTWDTARHAFAERLNTHASRSHIGDAMTSLLGDVRYALRSLASQPLYALLVVLMMTLAIAGNSAVFRIFNGLYLRPLAFQDPHELVDMDETAPQWNLEFVGIAYPDFVAWREHNRSFEGMAVFTGDGASFAADGEAVRVEILQASHDLAEVLGIEPVLGRFFTAAEDVPDGPAVAVLSDGFWERRFGRDPGVIGRTISLDGRAHEVIGVLPRAGYIEQSVWVPLQEDVAGSTGWYLEGIGRLRDGVTMEQARDDLLRVHKGLVDEREVNEVTAPVLHSFRDRYLGDMQLGSWVLLGAVGVILLIACANIAGLMLARSLHRMREMGIRVAMGAGRQRIVRQLLTESLLLATAGAAIGAALGTWGSSWLVGTLSDQLPAWISFDLDARFVAFTVLATVGAAVLFGLAPAIQTSRVDPAEVLQSATTRSSASRGRRRAMSLLASGQIAMALTLLVVAGLTVRDLRELRLVDPGFEPDNLLTYVISLPDERYEEWDEVAAFFDEHVERLSALPGVTGATAASALPLSGHWGWFYHADDAPPRAEDEATPVVLNRVVRPDYFDVMGVSLVAGRGLDEFDGRDVGSRAVVVNESFAREFLSHRDDPLGARIGTGADDGWMTVVGVTRDVLHYGVDEPMRPGVYQPFRQFGRRTMQIAVRTAGDPTEMVASARALLRDMDPQLAAYAVETMDQKMDDALFARRAASLLVAAFSAVALLLAVAGIYGVISYGVGQRSHEISIRLALGAQRRQVLREVVGQGMRLVAAGVVVGLAGAILLAPAVAGMLVGVDPRDPVVYAGVTLLLVAVAVVANVLPARRASRLEPMGALRSD